jgi:hypothetical protein
VKDLSGKQLNQSFEKITNEAMTDATYVSSLDQRQVLSAALMLCSQTPNFKDDAAVCANMIKDWFNDEDSNRDSFIQQCSTTIFDKSFPFQVAINKTDFTQSATAALSQRINESDISRIFNAVNDLRKSAGSQSANVEDRQSESNTDIQSTDEDNGRPKKRFKKTTHQKYDNACVMEEKEKGHVATEEGNINNPTGDTPPRKATEEGNIASQQENEVVDFQGNDGRITSQQENEVVGVQGNETLSRDSPEPSLHQRAKTQHNRSPSGYSPAQKKSKMRDTSDDSYNLHCYLQYNMNDGWRMVNSKPNVLAIVGKGDTITFYGVKKVNDPHAEPVNVKALVGNLRYQKEGLPVHLVAAPQDTNEKGVSQLAQLISVIEHDAEVGQCDNHVSIDCKDVNERISFADIAIRVPTGIVHYFDWFATRFNLTIKHRHDDDDMQLGDLQELYKTEEDDPERHYFLKKSSVVHDHFKVRYFMNIVFTLLIYTG